MSHDDLVSYSDLVMEYRSAGYALDGMEVLKRYFNQVKLHMIRPFLYYFKEIFPEEYKQFLEEEKEELRNYLFFYYEEVMMDFIDEDESITSGEALIRWAKYDFQEYRLDGIQSLCSVLEEYMTYLEDITEVIDNDAEMLNKENLDYNEIIYAAKRDILREESVFDFEDCQNRIIYSDLSDATKTELLEIYETESPWYIYEFMKCNESFTVLKKVAQNKFMMHRIDLFYSQIVCEFAPEIEISERQFIIFMFELCNLISCRETLFLSKKEVLHLDAYQKFFNNDSKPLDHFVASGVLCKNGKWYMPAHVLMVLIPFAMCVVSQPLNYKVDFYGLLSQGQCKRYSICQNISGEIEQEWYTADMGFYYFHRQDWEEMLYKLLFDLDEENFVEHFVNPAWTAFYKEIDGREDSTIRFMEKLGLGYHIKRGENNPNIVMYVDSLWPALCSIDVVNIWNILLFEFSTIQLDYVELNMQEENNIYYIKIDRHCPEEFIELLGLREKITDIIDRVNNFLGVNNTFA